MRTSVTRGLTLIFKIYDYISCKVQFSWGFSFRGFSGSLEISIVTSHLPRVLAVTRKWNVAGKSLFTFAVQYAVKIGKFTYNCITTMNLITNNIKEILKVY